MWPSFVRRRKTKDIIAGAFCALRDAFNKSVGPRSSRGKGGSVSTREKPFLWQRGPFICNTLSQEDLKIGGTKSEATKGAHDHPFKRRWGPLAFFEEEDRYVLIFLSSTLTVCVIDTDFVFSLSCHGGHIRIPNHVGISAAWKRMRTKMSTKYVFLSSAHDLLCHLHLRVRVRVENELRLSSTLHRHSYQRDNLG